MAIEADITISLPDVITVDVWQVFTDGQQSYYDQCERDKRPAAAYLANYYGVLNLIRKGYVHIGGVEALKRIIEADVQGTTPMAVVGYLVRAIAVPIAQAVDAPLALAADFSGESSAGTTPS